MKFSDGGKFTFDLNVRSRGGANARDLIDSDRKQFFGQLLDNVKDCMPDEGSLIDVLEIFDLQLAPAKEDEMEFLEANEARLHRLFELFSSMTVLKYSSVSERAESVASHSLLPVGLTLAEFLSGFFRMLPVMRKAGDEIRSRFGTARINSYGTHEFKVAEGDPQRYYDQKGEELNIAITHPNRWAKILNSHGDLEPGFCSVVRIMLSYHVNSAGPERIFSQVWL